MIADYYATAYFYSKLELRRRNAAPRNFRCCFIRAKFRHRNSRTSTFPCFEYASLPSNPLARVPPSIHSLTDNIRPPDFHARHQTEQNVHNPSITPSFRRRLKAEGWILLWTKIHPRARRKRGGSYDVMRPSTNQKPWNERLLGFEFGGSLKLASERGGGGGGDARRSGAGC
ncbi:Hypothetical predicted protein [Podarcis lilfordi]|uniref:Uncharacterized protein n=1 Tax=Podarcis lilfordi TaxID=74358 RepID=A0AA35JR57_9SAUR|nr:Hypothetical predicted protein [Podarcis lilfordi]